MKEKMEVTSEFNSVLEAVMSLRGNCSANRARKLLKSGVVAINGNIVKLPTAPIKKGQILSIVDPSDLEGNKEAPYQIMFEDDMVCVFQKPIGVPALKSGSKIASASDNMIAYLRKKNGDEVYTVMNRVDKKESGLMIIGIGLKTSRFLKEEANLKYRHYAIVEGKLREEKGRWEHHLKVNSIGLFKGHEAGKGRESITDYQVMKMGGGFSLLKLAAHDYFKGQLRAQCALRGCPIAGDKRYGAKTNPLAHPCLHLFSISFIHPKSGERMDVKTKVPTPFLSLLKR